MNNGGEDEGRPRSVLGHHAVVLQDREEIFVAGLADEVCLTGGVDGQDLGPDGDEERP